MVLKGGVEPPHLTVLVPKTSASASSATPAFIYISFRGSPYLLGIIVIIIIPIVVVLSVVFCRVLAGRHISRHAPRAAYRLYSTT